MKKLYIAITLVLMTASVFAQIPYRHVFGSAMTRAEIQDLKEARLPALNSSTRDLYQMYVDYDYAAFDDLHYVWLYNSSYTATDDFPLNYQAVVMNYLIGYTDPADPVNSFIDWSVIGLDDSLPSNVVVTIDSFYNLMSHENNTGHLDTLVMKIVKTSANGAPSTAASNIIWSQRDSVDFSLSTYGSWLGDGAAFYWVVGPGLTLAPGQKVAGVFEYYNKDKMDTLGVLGGCIDDGAGYAASFSIYQNSYMRLPPNIPNVTKNSNIGYDTDGDMVIDQAFEAQDWNMIFQVTINTEVGIADNFDNLKVTGITPNPASGATNILYGLNKASDVTINLYDLSGRMLSELYHGKDGAGSFIRNVDVSDLSSGTYFVSVQAGNGTPVSSKLIVNR